MNELQTVVSDYWRNRTATIVHTSECIHVKSEGSQPWRYAQGKTRDWVRELVQDVVWLRLCKRCWKEEE